MADQFHDLEHKVEDTFHTLEDEAKDYFFGSSNFTSNADDGTNGTAIPVEETDCDYLMNSQEHLGRYWEAVGAAAALFVAAFIVPYLLCCCNSRWPRCASKWFFTMGLLQWVIGILLATYLMPECLEEMCGAHFCSAHKNNPGQVWGGVVIGLGFVLMCKSCGLRRYAKHREQERNIANEAEKGALVSNTIDTMMEDSQRGSYKDKPSKGNDFPDSLL